MRRQSVSNLLNKRTKLAWLQQYKVERGCETCGERHPACLSFHHAEGDKDKGVTKLATRYASWERITGEVAKCVVLCENCHRKLHWERGDRGYSPNNTNEKPI